MNFLSLMNNLSIILYHYLFSTDMHFLHPMIDAYSYMTAGGGEVATY